MKIVILLDGRPACALALAGDRAQHRREVLFSRRTGRVVNAHLVTDRRLPGDLEAAVEEDVC